MFFLCVFLMESLIISWVWEMLIKRQSILQRWYWTSITISILHCKSTSFSFTGIAGVFKTLRLLPFFKDLVVLLLNCRNNVHIPEFLCWNWYSTGSLVVSTLECDARMPMFKPWPRQFPHVFIYFFQFWYFWF